jgi:cation diffusion facilitator CzcD-associated flavoprotein CzcO
LGVDHRIVIVGAGFAGLGTAIRLKQAGIGAVPKAVPA